MGFKIYFLLFFLITGKGFASSKGECSFEETSKTVFCFGITFEQLLSYPNTTFRLDIAHSDFSTISTSAFDQYARQNPQLNYLSLRDVKKKDISPGAFSKFPNLDELLLEANEIEVIPRNAFNEGLKKLSLRENHIRHIGSHAIALNKLISLDFALNNITTIEREAFKLPELRTLEFSFNKISSIDKDVFLGLPKLEALYLAFNQISSIDKDAFRGLDSLKILDMRKNSIQALVPGMFRALKSLESLDLGSNKIENILEGAFDNLKNLQNLRLFKNKLKTLERYHFQSLSNLKSLHLESNLITTIGKDTFRLPNLRLINLASNNITHFDRASLGIRLPEREPGVFHNYETLTILAR